MSPLFRAELEDEEAQRLVAGIADAMPIPRPGVHEIAGVQRLLLAVQGPGALAFDHILEFLVGVLMRWLQLLARQENQRRGQDALGTGRRRGVLGIDVNLSPLALRRTRSPQ